MPHYLPKAVPLDRAALFLDLDGTLAPFAPTPEGVAPEPRRTALLRAAGQRLGGRLAVVSGREIASVDRIVERAVLAVAGVHGLERRDGAGRLTRTPPHPELVRAGDVLQTFADSRPGVLVERKALGVAVHVRNAPEAEDEARALARRLAEDTGLILQDGNKVAELRTPGADKGDALRAFMAEPPFAGAVPVFVGDDLTDEHGFQALGALGGWGVLVGPPRATAATSRLDSPAAVLDWLAACLDGGALRPGAPL